MNEQIFKIAKQADTLAREIEPDLREIVRYNRIRDEKFAELIVRECIEVSINNGCGDFVDIEQKLLEHFGVKE